MNGNFAAAMDDINVIPVLEGPCNLMVRLFVCLAQSLERLTRKHYTPAESVVGSIPFVDSYLMRGVGLFHEDGEIQTRRTATDDVDLH